MTRHLPDANILIHCLREESPAHKPCLEWLENLATNGDTLLLCELVEVAFLRINTLPSLQIAPVKVALRFWNDLKRYPESQSLAPGARHAEIFESLISAHKLVGNDLNDAWIAALAIEHGATLVSTDDCFARFPGLLWSNPLQPR